MTDSHNPFPRHAQSVDLLFAHLDGATRQVSSSPSFTMAGPLGGSARLQQLERPIEGPGEPFQPPPLLETSADLKVAYEWLQAERQRLEVYTRSQFETIQQQHQALLAKHFRGEETLALRSQELNREMQFLGSQAEALQKRARELAEREAALTAQMQKLADA